MHMGMQLHAPQGYEFLRKDVVYYFLRSDARTARTLLIEYCPVKLRRKPRRAKLIRQVETAAHLVYQPPSGGRHPAQYRSRPVLRVMARSRFESGVGNGQIVPCPVQRTLPPWLGDLTVADLRTYSEERTTRKKAHADRIDQMLAHLWPLVQNLDQNLSAVSPDALINAHAKSCSPVQNATRLRAAFYTYICFGMNRWALHYAVGKIGKWDRTGRDRKFGRTSLTHGANHGYGSNDPEMIRTILEGYRRFAGPQQHMSKIYQKTIRNLFGCVTQTDPSGRKSFIHPTGKPFPTLGQFAYRVAEAFPLDVRQIYKFGYARVRSRLRASEGRFAESTGNLMERTEQDAYCCDQVAIGYRPNSHLPALWVVRTRCITSGMIVGIGFSVGGELATAYRLAKFCEAIDKVTFCRLLGLQIKPEDWPSIGVSPHVINDRGPGSTEKAEATDPAFRPLIREAAPSYSGQSKASIETTHPKRVKLEGKPSYQETTLTIPQLALQEVLRTLADNQSIDVSDRLNNDAVADGIFPNAISLWNHLDHLGRNHAVHMTFEDAVWSFLTPIELTVRDDGVYFMEQRFDSDALRQSGIIQRSHMSGRIKVKGFMFDVCLHHLWLDLGTQLIEVNAMLGIRDSDELSYISEAELEQLKSLRLDGHRALKAHKLAARSEYESMFESFTGVPFEQSVLKRGRHKRSKANSQEDRREIIGYLCARGDRR